MPVKAAAELIVAPRRGLVPSCTDRGPLVVIVVTPAPLALIKLAPLVDSWSPALAERVAPLVRVMVLPVDVSATEAAVEKLFTVIAPPVLMAIAVGSPPMLRLLVPLMVMLPVERATGRLPGCTERALLVAIVAGPVIWFEPLVIRLRPPAAVNVMPELRVIDPAVELRVMPAGSTKAELAVTAIVPPAVRFRAAGAPAIVN